MAQVRWSLTAAGDLRDIEEYVARDSPVYAVRLVDRIVASVERLERHPLSGRIVPEFTRDDLREVISGAYRIVYLVNEDTCHVLRVVHGARDIAALAEDLPWDLIH
jgi:toxin ParE1/3/4